MTLYLIRHTRPDIAPGICYGQLDPDVADSFADEAIDINNWLPAVDLIISSPLLRTRRLADYLARCCEVRTDARLMEKHFGIWEGISWDDIDRRQINAWAADIMDYVPPGGESARQLMLRVQDFLSALTPLRNVAVVAHGGSIRAILALLANVPLQDTLNWQIEYGSVIAVKIDGAFSCRIRENKL
jgi:alpha-ribazole phosphatase